MRSALLLFAVLSLPACAALEPHAPPPVVTSDADLDALNAKIDALGSKLTGAITAAATGNVVGSAAQGAEAATGVMALAKEYGLSIPDVLLAVLMSLGGVRFWRGSTTKRKGYAPRFPPTDSTKP